jgi:hypothetical protein
LSQYDTTSAREIENHRGAMVFEFHARTVSRRRYGRPPRTAGKRFRRGVKNGDGGALQLLLLPPGKGRTDSRSES